MQLPPPNLQALFQIHATQKGVPYTLLCAIAFHESGYNPNREGAQTKSGKAIGLFQLMPGVVEGYEVANPYDPADNTDGAARLLRFLIDKYAYDWDAVLSAYHAGATFTDKLLQAKKPYPSQVLEYQAAVSANRRAMQRALWAAGNAPPSAAKPGQQKLDLSQTALQRLNDAMLALEAANPTPQWPDANELAVLLTNWRQWYTPARGNQPDGLIVKDSIQLAFWDSYARRYDRAPLTPGRVPPPWEIAPTLWEQYRALAQKVTDRLREAKDALVRATQPSAAPNAGQPVMVIDVDDPQRDDSISFLALLAAFCGFVLLANHHRRD